MSKFGKIVGVCLGEIRVLEGEVAGAYKPGTLVIPKGNYNIESNGHVTDELKTGSTGTVTLTAAGAGTTKNLAILLEDPLLVKTSDGTAPVTKAYTQYDWARAHLLKTGDEVTVILNAAATVNPGDLLKVAANGTVTKLTVGSADSVATFVAVEAVANDATGDGLRFLARVL